MEIYSTLLLMMFRAITHIFWMKETIKQPLHLNYYAFLAIFCFRNNDLSDYVELDLKMRPRVGLHVLLTILCQHIVHSVALHKVLREYLN